MEKLVKKINQTVNPEIKKKHNYKNLNQVVRIEKVIVSCGVGNFKDDAKMIDNISSELTKITGQKPMINRSRKAVSSFKLRTGQPVGLTVTLRGERMYDFIDRLINIAIPRVRDFRGLPLSSFDGCGNYAIGIKEHTIFPEIKYESVTHNFGFQINIKTNSKSDQDSRELLEFIGFPFEKKEKNNG